MAPGLKTLIWSLRLAVIRTLPSLPAPFLTTPFSFTVLLPYPSLEALCPGPGDGPFTFSLTHFPPTSVDQILLLLLGSTMIPLAPGSYPCPLPTLEKVALFYIPCPIIKGRSLNIAMSVGISFSPTSPLRVGTVSCTDFICLSIERMQEMINYRMDE